MFHRFVNGSARTSRHPWFRAAGRFQLTVGELG
jgi:hypothetical protein